MLGIACLSIRGIGLGLGMLEFPNLRGFVCSCVVYTWAERGLPSQEVGVYVYTRKLHGAFIPDQNQGKEIRLRDS